MLTLRQKLRASHVKRWHIVECTRNQTVAEHSFNVAILAEEICNLINADEQFKNLVRQYAIHHDIPEIALGDLPTSVKSVFGEEAIVEVNNISKTLDPLSAVDSPMAYRVVKLADLLDSVIFLAQHGVGTHAKKVRDLIITNIGTVLFKFDYQDREKLMRMVNLIKTWDTDQDLGEDILWPN
jgi:5'-deoxynucleotidase YfbR-like HD superfamily hydrolase